MPLLPHLQAALNVTGPVLCLLLVGIGLKRIGLIDGQFVSAGNKLVFNVTLPSLLLSSVALSSPEQSLNPGLVLFAILATLASVAALWLIAPLVVKKTQRGVFVQCAFRGNMGIVGLALCVNAFGDDILPMAAVYLAFLTILYNVVAVVLLSDSRLGVLVNLAKNPLILAILVGLLWSYAALPMPTLMKSSLGYLAQLTLPLALLCIGANLEWTSFKANHRQAAAAAALKLVILPALVVASAVAYGFSGEALGVLFLMMSAPTAAAAYIMSKQMTTHGNLAAEIVTLSTAISPVTVTLGLVALSYYQLL